MKFPDKFLSFEQLHTGLAYHYYALGDPQSKPVELWISSTGKYYVSKLPYWDRPTEVNIDTYGTYWVMRALNEELPEVPF